MTITAKQFIEAPIELFDSFPDAEFLRVSYEAGPLDDGDVPSKDGRNRLHAQGRLDILSNQGWGLSL